MSVLENRPVDPAEELPVAPTHLIVAADDDGRGRIGEALARAGQEPDAVIESRAALAEREVDETYVVIVACDVNRPTEVTVLRKLSRAARGAAIIVVSPRVTATAVRRTLDAGADALVFESEIFQTLIPTLRAVESGQSVVPRNLRAGVERPYLSRREQQVLNLVCEGLTNAEIAATLVLAESTIKSHLASIFTKFGVHSRKEAVAVYLDLNASVPAEPDSDLELELEGARA
jgi:DNA-binding NarL/FixJ family response regulator